MPDDGTSLPRRAVLALIGVLALTLVVNIVPRFGYLSGDAMIHVLIAERLSHGAWFEFNPGEVSSGTTSVAWTVVEAALLRAGGHALLLRALPVIDLAGLLASMALVGSLARRVGASRPSAALGALLFGSLPAVAYNALLGMENIVFAAVALAFLDGWSRTAQGRSRLASAGLGALVGVAALLRPEGVLLGLVPLADLAARRRDPRAARDALVDALAAGALCLAVMAPFVWKHHAVTGHWVPGSGLSRVMTARRQATSFHLGALWVYLGVASRFVIYLPLTILAALGAIDAPDALDARARSARRALLVSLAATMVLYTFVTGAGHVGRLMQAVFAFACALAPRGLERAWARLSARPARRALALLAAAGLHVALVGGETALRFRDPTQRHGGGHDLAWVTTNLAARPASTERALAMLCESGCCRPGHPPAIGFVEVQMRYLYDERVRVASFDGRTSSLAPTDPHVTFDARGCPHLGPILADPSIVAVGEPPYKQFPGCPTEPLGAQMTASWDAPGHPAPPGWRWDERLPGWFRVCSP